MKVLERARVHVARRKKGIPKKVTPTGRIIDMTKSMWGWSLAKWEYDETTDTVRTGGWCFPRPVIGDELKVENGDKTFQMICLTVEYYRDSDDMWFANVQLAP